MPIGFQKEQSQVLRSPNSWNKVTMKDTLHTIITAIVEHPDDVKVIQEDQEGIVTLTLTVNPADMGRIIGKNGKVIRSIRNVMKIPAIKQNKRIDISLSEA